MKEAVEILLKCLAGLEQGSDGVREECSCYAQLPPSLSLPSDLPLWVFYAFQMEAMSFNLLDSSEESSETWLQMARKELGM